MQKVTSEISMSLDGFITDPEASVGSSLEGHDPGRLREVTGTVGPPEERPVRVVGDQPAMKPMTVMAPQATFEITLGTAPFVLR